MSRVDKDKERISVPCSGTGCSDNATPTYGHYRRNKDAKFYCNKCAQQIRVDAMKKVLSSKDEKEKRRNGMSDNNPMKNLTVEQKESWKMKLSESSKKRGLDNMTEDQKRIFGDKWSTMTQQERDKYPAEVECLDCGNVFTMTYGKYRRKPKDYHWRCRTCHYINHGKTVEKNWANRTPDENAKIRMKQQKSATSGKDRSNKFEEKFENLFSSSFILNPYYYKKGITVDNIRGKIWDYGIYSKTSDNLLMVVDLDGSYYHADNGDYDGIHSHEELDQDRFSLVPIGIKISIIYELQFVKSFEKMIQDLETDYDRILENQFQTCRSIPFPSPSYTLKELFRSYNGLLDMSVDPLKFRKEIHYLNSLQSSNYGGRIISHFHPSIYYANYRNRPSPYDAWYDDDLLKKVIRNRFLYINTLNRNKILQGFNVSRIAPKVSVFSASKAKILIYKYLNEYPEIFDPFSGFSGRMLGAISLGRKYIGHDISPIHVRESNDILTFLRDFNYDVNSSTVTQADILESSGEYQCLFTCSPYSNKEQWLDIPIDLRSCDDWISECISRFRCKRYMFVVDETKRYSDYIVTEIRNRSHIGSNCEKVIVL